MILLDNNINQAEDSDAIKILSSLYRSQSLIDSAFYFKIKGKNTLGSFTGFVAVNQVMDNIYPEKKIDWELVPETYLYVLFSEKCSQLLFPFSKEMMSVIVDNICLGEQKKERYPVVNTSIGNVFICSFEGHYEWRLSLKNKISAIAQFQLGNSKISVSLLKNLLLGDIVLIDNIDFSLILGEKKWMSYQWQEGENTVVLDEELLTNEMEKKALIEDVDTNATRPENIDLKSIDTIPITLSFLLASKILPIEQIEKLAPGQQLILPDNASRHIILVVNGVAIAEGELIKVGERLAVEIQHSHLQQD
ncbi:FliM/FliN family flagellar motor switch protein [Proteus alimentorum]|uniref:FliM/FliN family flagellar motor switch protein n=1 Tax=Proteus alimentorum TaxID=1973495 RepID=UPI000BFF88C2|nr:FliM/FliN family flagellar motor switch protein [Proteus alimentorum]